MKELLGYQAKAAIAKAVNLFISVINQAKIRTVNIAVHFKGQQPQVTWYTNANGTIGGDLTVCEIADDAVLSKRFMDDIIAKTAHEILHPVLTLKKEWDDLCKRRPDLRGHVNGAEDCRIEWINKRDQLQAGAIVPLVNLITQMIEDADAHGWDASNEDEVAWTIAALGRARFTYNGLLSSPIIDKQEALLSSNVALAEKVDSYLTGVFADADNALNPIRIAEEIWPAPEQPEQPPEQPPEEPPTNPTDNPEDEPPQPPEDGPDGPEGQPCNPDGPDGPEGEPEDGPEDGPEGDGKGKGKGNGEGPEDESEDEPEDEPEDEGEGKGGKGKGVGKGNSTEKFDPKEWEKAFWEEKTDAINEDAELTAENGYQEWDGSTLVVDMNELNSN